MTVLVADPTLLQAQMLSPWLQVQSFVPWWRWRADSLVPLAAPTLLRAQMLCP